MHVSLCILFEMWIQVLGKQNSNAVEILHLQADIPKSAVGIVHVKCYNLKVWSWFV